MKMSIENMDVERMLDRPIEAHLYFSTPRLRVSLDYTSLRAHTLLIFKITDILITPFVIISYIIVDCTVHVHYIRSVFCTVGCHHTEPFARA